MNMTDTADKWYALFVITGQEDNVRERLAYRLKDNGIRMVVPKRHMKERKDGVWEMKLRTLFPGYILVNGSLGVKEYYAMKGVPGLIRILRDKSGLLEISPNEISVISRLVNDNETIGSSKVFLEGGKVTVTEGPLLGMEGLIESVDKRKGRAKVRINFIGEARLVDLSISIVQTA